MVRWRNEKSPKTNKRTKRRAVLSSKNSKVYRYNTKSTDNIIFNTDEELKEELIRSVCGYSRKSAESLRRIYLKEGIESIDTKPRGIRSLLRQEEFDEIVRVVKPKKPNEVMYHRSEYWNISILGRYIECKKKRGIVITTKI